MTRDEFRTIVLAYISTGKYKEAARALWPWVVQNEWTDKIWDALEQNRFNNIMGHGSASKTWTCCMYFLLDWWRDPTNTALLLTSATYTSMQGRIWSDMKRLFIGANNRTRMAGILVDSRAIIKAQEWDQKNAIQAIAGQSDDADSKIQGIHTKRIRIIIDEADNPFSESIWSAISNLTSSGDVKAVALANPADRSSKFGMNCEPKEGWDSINPEVNHVWVSRTGWNTMRLDGLQSPNIKAGKDLFPFLLTNQGMRDILEQKGVNSVEWWKYVRAMFPPEGTLSTIFTYEILNKATTTHHQWVAPPIDIAAMDPALDGGDNCVMLFGKFGHLVGKTTRPALEARSWVILKRKDTSIPASTDFGDQAIALCKVHNIEPENFAVDSSGTTRGVADHIRASWSMKVVAVNFSGDCSESRATSEDSAKASERYDRFVTELWWVAREWCRLGMVSIQNLGRDARVQFVSRIYTTLPRGKIKIESKKDMKKRGLPSPDEADVFCILVHLARRLSGGYLPGSTRDTPSSADFFKKLNTKTANVFEPAYASDD